MTVEHETIQVERDYPQERAKVFAAWSDAALKRRWFDLTDGDDGEWCSDFRVGGVESFRSPAGAAPYLTYEAVHRDIVTDERIVLTSEITIDGRRASLTLSTVELGSTTSGTRVRIIDQAAFLDGLEDAASRRSGMLAQLDRLAAVLIDH